MFLWDKSYRLKGFGFYILGSFILIIFSFIGQLPMIPFLPTELPSPEANPMDLFKSIPSNLRLFLLLLSFVAVVPGIWLVVKKLHDLPIMSILSGRKKIDLERIMFSFMLWGSIVSAFIFLEYSLSPENYEINFKLKEFLILAVIAILLIPIQTSVEEIVFRGYLMQGFGHWLNSRFMALFLTSVVFGSLHLANPEITALGYEFVFLYITVGFVLGIMTLMDDGLELSLGFHAANNLIAALLLTADWTVFQTESILIDISEPSLGITDWISPFIVYPILLAIFAKKYSWTNWKEKLFSKTR
ncbi:MAG: CPBP family intramembrane metalloprotease [Flavobacteriaceae bacterium]|nr:CPBP family intramembrane metalloprotease [Flavobacteriaceae bacterium]|tara:strand:- start:831 stop:1733 length:903 start_codon:yes stop_codon:yes gene_type:complete